MKRLLSRMLTNTTGTYSSKSKIISFVLPRSIKSEKNRKLALSTTKSIILDPRLEDLNDKARIVFAHTMFVE